MSIFSFKKNKAITAILYIIKGVDYCNVNKIMEVFYTSNIDHLVSFARPITNIDFIKNKDSVESTILYQVLKEMIENNDISLKGKTIVSDELVFANVEPDLIQLSFSDIRALNHMIVSHNNGEALFKNKAWVETKNNQIITLDLILKSIGDNDLIDHIYKRN